MIKQYEALKQRLETEKARLAAELDQFQEDSNSDERREGSPFGKREEEATETLELEKRLALETRNRTQIAGIDHALEKFQNGTYGKCDNCGKPIAPARLEALPQASLCMDCKALEAKNGKNMPLG
ncbi:TraR/DksA family transcriptional regulator [Chloroflexota bacterium]